MCSTEVSLLALFSFTAIFSNFLVPPFSKMGLIANLVFFLEFLDFYMKASINLPLLHSEPLTGGQVLLP